MLDEEKKLSIIIVYAWKEKKIIFVIPSHSEIYSLWSLFESELVFLLQKPWLESHLIPRKTENSKDQELIMTRITLHTMGQAII